MKNIVSQQWFMENKDREDLIIFDARAGLTDPDYGYEGYKEGHIENAYFVSMEDTMTGELGEHGGRHPIPDINIFAEEMKEFGVEDNSTIVIYDDGELSIAGRLWWLLKYIGKKNVHVLEGGIKAWIENGNSITKTVPIKKPATNLTINVNPNMKVDMDYVKKSISSNKSIIVDARARERYRGEVEPLDKRAGHIPGSYNIPWMELLDGVNLLKEEKLNQKFEEVKNYDEIILHCGSGITATVNAMIMEDLGISTKIYMGGYSDWVSYDSNQVVIEG